MTRRPLGLCLLLAGCMGLASLSARADLIRLGSGGELRGSIVRIEGSGPGERITLETLSGAVVTVERGEIRFVTRRPKLIEEYESRVRRIAETAEAHWDLSEWCRQNALKEQRNLHLERVVELDPGHEAAHRALGHTLRDGIWMSRDEIMTAQGYVKHKGRYITRQELELIEKTQAERDQELDWFRKVRLWHGWLTGRHEERRQTGRLELEQIADPHAVPALVRFLGDDENRAIREFCVAILAEIGGAKPVPALVNLSLRDPDVEIRLAALNAIREEQREAAIPFYLAELKNDLNAIVRRAGACLGCFEDTRVIPPLIDALVTTHRYRIRVPGSTSPTFSFGTDGSFAGGTALPPDVELMLRSGQLPYGAAVHQVPPPGQELRTKIVTVKYDHQNPEVLTALQKLTGENHGYDERTWRLWWAAEKHGAEKLPTLQ